MHSGVPKAFAQSGGGKKPFKKKKGGGKPMRFGPEEKSDGLDMASIMGHR